MKQFKYFILLALPVLLWSCKDEIAPDLGSPTIKFADGAGEYKVKKGRSITLAVTVEDAVDPIYVWRLNGEIISTELECEFTGDHIGEFFVTFRVDAKNGSDEQQIKVSVLEKIAPEINMPSEMVAYSGQNTKITADVLYADNASYIWRLNGVVVSESKEYTYNQTALGAQTLTLKVSTEDGVDLQVFTITTLPEPEPEIFFDNGHYRTVTNASEMRKMSVSLGRGLVLAPVICNIPNPSTFIWTVDGEIQSSTSEFFTFTPTEKREYLITVTESSTSKRAEVTVTCTEPEGTYFRAKTAESKATAATAFDYIPAPGQFINYQINSTKARALQDLQNSLNSGSASYVGAYGGYWIVGFDHSVENVQDKADIRITGNAFRNWSEPGIVWVMQDENGNGVPDDTWYELKGSEANNPETKYRHAITYYRPQASGSNVLWTDNIGRTGSVDYNGYHSQAYYFPMFITEEYYTLVGTLLPPTFFTEGGIEYSRDLDWGYVDNYSTDISRPMNEFWIEDAIRADGSPANLKYIDFVKVHTGAIGKGAAVGEVSTEPGCPTNMNF